MSKWEKILIYFYMLGNILIITHILTFKIYYVYYYIYFLCTIVLVYIK